MTGTGDRLRFAPVVTTIDRLHERMTARFPTRSLPALALELREVATDVAATSARWRRWSRVVQVACRVLMVLLVVLAIVALTLITRGILAEGPQHSFEWVPLIESFINNVIFVGAALFLLHALPARLGRGHLLEVLHRLRSLAHIIDMHQLTKDPERLRTDFRATSASVDPDLDRAGMEHYLDYCSELLSLTGKVAALCAEQSTDDVVLTTVSTVENLTTELSRKIWQKIALLPD